MFQLFKKKTPEKAANPSQDKEGKAATGGHRPSRNSGSNKQKSAKTTKENKNNKANTPNPTDQSSQSKSSKTKPNKRRRHPSRKKTTSWDISQFKVEEQAGKTRFHDLGLELPLMRAIADLKFEYCSPIQAQSLPTTLKGYDLLGKAQTGTGKTAAFLIAMIDDFLKNPIDEERYAGEARGLIVAPTRELVMQIADDAKSLAKYTNLGIHTLVGGMDYEKQKRKVNDKFIDILVATPGRLLDFISSQDVYLDQVEVLVLDEADRMLDMGFIPQVRRIVRATPHRQNRQTLFFSATFTDDVMRLAEQWTCDPVSVEIQPKSVATETVEQHVYIVSTDEKLTFLLNIVKQDDVESLIVFANRRDECRRLHQQLQQQGLSVGLLSGEIAQGKRIKTLDAFKNGRLKVLVATDVAGRGIHIDGISHVVNYTLPEEPEDYVHRIGRTGRAGSEGVSISFACEDDAFRLPALESLLGRKIECKQAPSHLIKPVK